MIHIRPLVFINTPLGTFTPTRSGAVATVIWETCLAAAKTGVRPWVISRRDPEAEAYDWERLILIEPVRQPTSKAGIFIARGMRKLQGHREMRHRVHAKRVLKAIQSKGLEEATLILNNDPDTARYLSANLPHARVIHHFHNQHTSTPRTTRMLAEAAQMVTGISRFTLNWAQNNYSLDKQRTAVVPNGVDVKAFHPTTSEPGRLVPVVSFLGRTGSEKGLDVMLDALLIIANKNDAPRFSVKVIGSNHWGPVEMDAYQNQLRRQAKDLEDLGIEVKFTGHVPRAQVPEELRDCDVHVVPSRWEEPFGLTTLEGMACGLPVVATNTGGTPEVVGDAAALVPPDNPQAMADAIRPLLESKTARSEASKRCLERARMFTWDSVWEAWQGVLGMPISKEAEAA